MRKEKLNLTDELRNYFIKAKKEIKNRLYLKKDINREEVYQQVYRETANFVMKKFQLTLDEACTYVSMNPSYSMAVKIKASKILIETNLKRNGQHSN